MQCYAVTVQKALMETNRQILKLYWVLLIKNRSDWFPTTTEFTGNRQRQNVFVFAVRVLYDNLKSGTTLKEAEL